MSSRRIDRARIDIPLSTTYSYMFVAPMPNWDPWWANLLEYVRALATDDLDWHFDAEHQTYHAMAKLIPSQRDDLLVFLRTSPREEIDKHRALSRAVSIPAVRQQEIRVMFFSDPKLDHALSVS